MGLWVSMPETYSQRPNTPILCLAPPLQHLRPLELYIKGFLLQWRATRLGLAAKPGCQLLYLGTVQVPLSSRDPGGEN